jgi:hypothetical protein
MPVSLQIVGKPFYERGILRRRPVRRAARARDRQACNYGKAGSGGGVPLYHSDMSRRSEPSRPALRILANTPPWEWPKGAGATLLEIVRDRQAPASDRQTAAELAGDLVVMNDEIAGALLSIAAGSGEPEAVRARAAIGLGAVLERVSWNEFDEDPYDPMPITEETFNRIEESFRGLYQAPEQPKEVRRRVLEASVRAPQDWHEEAIRQAYAGADEEWKLTAVFAMRWVRGFDEQILESLRSRNPDIVYEAVKAAGAWEVDGAWPHVSALVASPKTKKDLLLAAIDAVADIRPQEAGPVLAGLMDSPDEEIAEAAMEAIEMARMRLTE